MARTAKQANLVDLSMQPDAASTRNTLVQVCTTDAIYREVEFQLHLLFA
jgi:hypothetical protein